MVKVMKSRLKAENAEKYENSGRNVQIFGMRKNVTEAEINDFFGKFGVIDEISIPTRADIHENVFYVSVLFEKAEYAEKAINSASVDEKKHIPRLSMTEIRVQKYVSKK